MGFERCHPAVNFLFFAGVLAGCWAFPNPVYLALALLCAMAFYVERRGLRAVPVIAASLALGVAFALYYSSYHHFGVTVLSRNFIGNARTLESLVKGAVLGGKLVCCILWLGCLHSVVTTDKIVYLFGRVSPMLALYLSGILRMVPRISRQSKKLDTARSAIGRGRGSGNVFSRINHFFRELSALITWTLEALGGLSDAARSRGVLLKGRRAYSVYRFDNRDRALVICLFAFLSMTLFAVLLGQTGARFDPYLRFPQVTALSYVGFMGYGAFCLLPMWLDVRTAIRFRSSRRKVGKGTK